MVVRGASVRVEKRVTDRTLPRVVLVLDCVKLLFVLWLLYDYIYLSSRPAVIFLLVSFFSLQILRDKNHGGFLINQ